MQQRALNMRRSRHRANMGMYTVMVCISAHFKSVVVCPITIHLKLMLLVSLPPAVYEWWLQDGGPEGGFSLNNYLTDYAWCMWLSITFPVSQEHDFDCDNECKCACRFAMNTGMQMKYAGITLSADKWLKTQLWVIMFASRLNLISIIFHPLLFYLLCVYGSWFVHVLCS